MTQDEWNNLKEGDYYWALLEDCLDVYRIYCCKVGVDTNNWARHRYEDPWEYRFLTEEEAVKYVEYVNTINALGAEFEPNKRKIKCVNIW